MIQNKLKLYFNPFLYQHWHCFIYQEHRMHKYFLIWLLSWRWHDWKKLLIQPKFHLSSCVCDSCHSIQSIILVYFHLPLKSFSRESWESLKVREKIRGKKIWSSLSSLYLKRHKNSLLMLQTVSSKRRATMEFSKKLGV